MDDSSSEIPQLEQLATRITKYDNAMDTVSDLHDRTLGTEDGPIQYDTSLIDKELFPEYHAKAVEQVRGVKLQLANRTFEKLLEQRDALSDLHGRATMAEKEFRIAEQEYLMSNGTEEDDRKFEDAYRRLGTVKEDIANVFQGRERKKEEAPTTEEVQENEVPKLLDTQPSRQEVVVREKSDVAVVPARIALETEELDYLEWVSKVDLSRVPAERQLGELAKKVAEIRTGKKPLPELRDFIDANTKMDNLKRRDIVATALEGLIATQILLPDGSINPRKGLPMILAKDINRVIAMTSPAIVAEAIGEMPSVEKGLLCMSLSVAMKEKVGIPDLEFCDESDAASYLSNAMYDVLKPARERRIRAQRRSAHNQNSIESEDITWQEPYHGRDTTMPVEVEDLLTVIVERDGRENGFAQGVIEALFRKSRENAKSLNSEAQKGILNNLLEELIDYCGDMDMLGELQEFFSSHPATSKYNRMISKMVDLDRGQQLVEYV